MIHLPLLQAYPLPPAQMRITMTSAIFCVSSCLASGGLVCSEAVPVPNPGKQTCYQRPQRRRMKVADHMPLTVSFQSHHMDMKSLYIACLCLVFMWPSRVIDRSHRCQEMHTEQGIFLRVSYSEKLSGSGTEDYDLGNYLLQNYVCTQWKSHLLSAQHNALNAMQWKSNVWLWFKMGMERKTETFIHIYLYIHIEIDR